MKIIEVEGARNRTLVNLDMVGIITNKNGTLYITAGGETIEILMRDGKYTYADDFITKVKYMRTE